MKVRTEAEIFKKDIALAKAMMGLDDDNLEVTMSVLEDKQWVLLKDLVDRIETICNHGNERDLRFRNLLFKDLGVEIND